LPWLLPVQVPVLLSGGATGSVTLAVAVAVRSPYVTVITADPSAEALTAPELDTVATRLEELAKVRPDDTTAVEPSEYVTVTVIDAESPAVRDSELGDTDIDTGVGATGAAETVTWAVPDTP